jgi:hypothetical protein
VGFRIGIKAKKSTNQSINQVNWKKEKVELKIVSASSASINTSAMVTIRKLENSMQAKQSKAKHEEINFLKDRPFSWLCRRHPQLMIACLLGNSKIVKIVTPFSACQARLFPFLYQSTFANWLFSNDEGEMK